MPPRKKAAADQTPTAAASTRSTRASSKPKPASTSVTPAAAATAKSAPKASKTKGKRAHPTAESDEEADVPATKKTKADDTAQDDDADANDSAQTAVEDKPKKMVIILSCFSCCLLISARLLC